MNSPQDLSSRIAALLAHAGLPTAIASIDACIGGGNNRTYRITAGNGIFAAKQYFRHEGDSRDRLATEFAFLSYANKVAPGFAPKPYAMDEGGGIALHEFVEGQALQPGEIGLPEVQQAAGFFQALNLPAARNEALLLPVASEACFSIQRHVDLIGQRLARLNEIAQRDAEDRQALRLVQKLTAHWQELVTAIAAKAAEAGVDPSKELEATQRCISPSDFGFHNALREADGNIRFLDFEYAGWDDPAKMTGDFFAQLALPVPEILFDYFVQACVAPFVRPAQLIKRAELLRPLYRVKWCCIALNVFLPVHIARRQFADPCLDETNLKRTQLAKACTLYQSLETSTHGLH